MKRVAAFSTEYCTGPQGTSLRIKLNSLRQGWKFLQGQVHSCSAVIMIQGIPDFAVHPCLPSTVQVERLLQISTSIVCRYCNAVSHLRHGGS